jgi:hypothetical protein
MSGEDAVKVARIFMQADGGCSVCARELFYLALKAFPKHDWKLIAKNLEFEYWDSIDREES